MTYRGSIARKALSVVIVALTAMGSLVGALSLLAPAARAQGCDITGSVISGDWTITTPQVCPGIVYTADGNIQINAGGSLTLTNGGLKFTEDATHIYTLSVNGGTLILDNSIVTTEPRSLSAYLRLNLTMTGGSLTMRNGAVLKFPGRFSSGNNAAIRIEDSTITGLNRTDVEAWVGGAWDDNDDAPGLAWDSSNVVIFDSRIEKLYERVTTPPAPAFDARMVVALTGTTTLTAANSYIGVDFNPGNTTVHNEMQADGTSRAFLAGVTIDLAGSGPQASWIPAFVATGSGAVYLYRWLDAAVTDSTGVPVEGAGIWSLMSPFTQTAFYPDNGNLFCPGATLLSYLGPTKTCGNFNVTGQDGRALIPLYTDLIDATTMPNAQSFGNFEVTASLPPNPPVSTVVFYDAYPIITESSNKKSVAFSFSGLTLPKPDLVPTAATFSSPHGSTPLAGDDVVIQATVNNTGPGDAAAFKVRFTDNFQGDLAEVTVPQLISGASTVLTVDWSHVAAGQHMIRVDVDSRGVVPETNEANNMRSFSVSVTPIGPDLTVSVSFDPSPGFAENTVHVLANVVNLGGANASGFYVEFKMGTLDANPYATIFVPSLSNSTIVSTSWVPSTTGTYRWCAVVDPDNRILEPAPYSEDNNAACADINVSPAPNLQIFQQDLRTSDPYPFESVPVTLGATIRNTGQATAGATFVDFYMDDSFIERRPVPALAVGASTSVSTTIQWTASGCGFHTLKAVLDPTNAIQEGDIYKQDNTVTSTVQVYPAGVVTWSFTRTLTGLLIPIASNVEITGTVTIIDGGIYVSQQSDLCNRALIKVTGSGRLILVNSTIGSNWPLTIYLAGNAQLTTSAGAALNLDSASGPGVLRSGGTSTIALRDTLVDGEILASGASSSFKGVTFEGSTLDVNTAGKSDIWGATFQGLTSLQLRSDDGNVNTADFDIRNTTFSAALTAQLRFSGHQWAQLTDVVTTLPPGTTDWWTGMISQNAKVSRYWWLRVESVDGTGTLLEGANAVLTIRRFDSTTLTFATPLPAPVAEDIYMATTITWPSVTAPRGFVVYRALAEDRFVSPNRQWVNATYLASGTATIDLVPYYPDANLTAMVQGPTTIRLIFSDLTPEMSIDRVRFFYGTVESIIQPINVELNITATVNNTGAISVRNVNVSFFAANVDVIGPDGVMDFSKNEYVNSGLWIGDFTIPLLQQRSTFVAWIHWAPTGVAETTRPISTVVDAPETSPTDNGKFRELSERNNIKTQQITLYTWPDLSVGTADVTPLQDFVVLNPTPVDITVHNDGTNDAAQLTVTLYEGGRSSIPITVGLLARGQSTTLRIVWTPLVAGLANLRIVVAAANNTIRNTDYNLVNNVADVPVTVRTQPDIVLLDAVQPPLPNKVRGVPFNMTAVLNNTGDTGAVNFTLSVFLDGNTNIVVGEVNGVNVPLRSFTNVLVRVTVNAVGPHNLTLYGDSRDAVGALAIGQGRIIEGNEGNNWANVSVYLNPPEGNIIITATLAASYQPGTALNVEGYVQDTAGGGLVGLPMTIELVAPGGGTLATVTRDSEAIGYWRGGLIVPQNAGDGTYTIRVSTTGANIPPASATVVVKNIVPWWMITVLGLPLWIWLIVIIIIVVIVLVVTVYFRVYGLGKMVECGECGSFIPEESTTCPKCGVEFEKDMAKCSNCQAWIPVDVKQCPECGVEFATGKVEMADYQEKMRMQYDEVVAKFREESQNTLGRALTEREFQDWWRKQPTFVTFEDWLREEEEMRKMGSKPCPSCGTLNSVTATVCHKCGTYLKEEKKPPTGGTPARREAAPTEAAAAKEAAPSEPIPKKVIRKPGAAPPVVQKKVVKRPVGEEQQEGGGESQSSEGEEF